MWHFFLQDGRNEMQQAIENKIISRVYGNGRGWAFSQADFADLGTRSAIDSALHRRAREGLIRRVIRGIYDYPRHSKALGSQTRLAHVSDAAAQLLKCLVNHRIEPWPSALPNQKAADKTENRSNCTAKEEPTVERKCGCNFHLHAPVQQKRYSNSSSARPKRSEHRHEKHETCKGPESAHEQRQHRNTDCSNRYEHQKAYE
jgi:hypothetical protein